jgi:hypothetical protein
MTHTAKRRAAHKVRDAVKHNPVIRLCIFVIAILVSVVIVEFVHARAETKAVGGISIVAFIGRGVEVLTDVVCDRFFPEL